MIIDYDPNSILSFLPSVTIAFLYDFLTSFLLFLPLYTEFMILMPSGCTLYKNSIACFTSFLFASL